MEVSPEQIQGMGERVVEFITHYLSNELEGNTSVSVEIDPDHIRDLVREPLPRAAQGFEQAFTDFERKIAATSVRVGHARFLAWVRTSPMAAAIYAEALAAALNQSVAIWEGGPSATVVERLVIEWLTQISGYSPGAGGLLTSGGSMANFTGLLAARTFADPTVREEGLAGKPPFTVYVTCETHLSVRKAVEMAGIGRKYVRTVAVDGDLRMSPSDLAARIHADRDGGLRPMAVVATLGSTNTGACDDLAAIGAVCTETGTWLHVDGSYGGFANLVPEKRHLVEGLSFADSLVLDPHKGLLIPYEAGCVLVKDAGILHQTFSADAAYLPKSHFDDPAAPFHYRDHGPQLSRGFRALKIYMALKTYGVDAFAAEIGRQYGLADTLAARIQASADFELLQPVSLGTVAFRYCGKGAATDEELDELNKTLIEAVNTRGQVFLSGTRIFGRKALRICLLSHHTRDADLEILLEEIRSAV